MTVKRHQVRAISTSIDRLTRPIFARRGFAAAGIVDHWAEIMGSALASASFPERISYPGQSRRGGTLHLRVESSALALEIQHLEPQIIERINSHFGYGAVGRVRILHGPIPRLKKSRNKPEPVIDSAGRAALAARLSGITDPELRDALQALGEGVQARNAAKKA
ncbi:MAG: hypothetical protein CMM10_08060 [Rhodospirillaceae bacterium]|jgi:hypothetical protein|nr:hypothetical protein [Rhodospirillaceae bacterium]|tara:strand:+ start:783 stop:1274 length:492 start_codon:yes stop_codon:yes gene_type:complete